MQDRAPGELTWDARPKKLTVNGTIFIDGSATIDSRRATQAHVTGQGALFLSGTFLMKNHDSSASSHHRDGRLQRDAERLGSERQPR